MFYVTVKGHMFVQNYLKACGFTIIISNIHVIQRRAITKFRRDENNVSFYVLCNISSMRRSVSSPNETLRREMKIRRAVDYEQSPIFPQGQQSERNASTRENHPTRKKATRGGERENLFIILSPCRVSPFLAWGDFHAPSRFARSTISEEKWGTTRSLDVQRLDEFRGVPSGDEKVCQMLDISSQTK